MTLPRLTPVAPQPGPQAGSPKIGLVVPPALVLPLFGNNAALIGVIPANISSILLQAGFIGFAYVTAVNGLFVPFQKPFPNGLLSIVYTPGTGGVTSVAIVVTGSSKAGGQFILFNGGAEAASGNYNMAYIALGW